MSIRHVIIIVFTVLTAVLAGSAVAGPRGQGASLSRAQIPDHPRLVTSRGVGPILLGLGVQDVAGRLPVDWTLRWDVHDLGDEGYIHNRLYFVVTRGGEEMLRGDISSAARVKKLTVLSPWFRTPDGLGVGVSFDRLARARGKLSCQGTGDFARAEYLRQASARSGNIEFAVCADLPGHPGCAGPLGGEIIPCHEWLGATWMRPARGMFEESPIVETSLSLGSIVVRDEGRIERETVSSSARSFLSRRCAELKLCRESGGCTAHVWEDGCPGCLPGSDADCAGSAACADLGACSRGDYRDGVYEFCRPTSNSHCAGAGRCQSHGECALDAEGSCAPGLASHCLDSDLCRKEGRCGRDERGRCAPESSVHCRGSTLCQEHGRCSLSDGGYSWSRKICAVVSRTLPHVAEAEDQAVVPDGVAADTVVVEEPQGEVEPDPAPRRRVKKNSKKRRSKKRPRNRRSKKKRR